MPMKIDVCKDCHTQDHDEYCSWCWECDKEMQGSNDLRPITIYTAADLDQAVVSLKAEIERKDAAIRNLIDGINGLPPLTAIVGALTEQCRRAEQALTKPEEDDK